MSTATLPVRRQLPSEMKVGTKRRMVYQHKIQNIIKVGGCPERQASYWMVGASLPEQAPVCIEPQNITDARRNGQAPEEMFTVYNTNHDILPEASELSEELLEFTTPQQRKALLDGKKVFSIQQCGDPYNCHYEATEVTMTGFIHCGNFPHYGRESLIRYIRAHYPECYIRIQR
jgi:hypothetical protein